MSHQASHQFDYPVGDSSLIAARRYVVDKITLFRLLQSGGWREEVELLISLLTLL